MQKDKLARIEKYVLDRFRLRASGKMLSKELFDSTGEFANADLVRGLEDMEKRLRLVVRYTSEGEDWVELTPTGARQSGITPFKMNDPSVIRPHPPKSAT